MCSLLAFAVGVPSGCFAVFPSRVKWLPQYNSSALVLKANWPPWADRLAIAKAGRAGRPTSSMELGSDFAKFADAATRWPCSDTLSRRLRKGSMARTAAAGAAATNVVRSPLHSLTTVQWRRNSTLSNELNTGHNANARRDNTRQIRRTKGRCY